MAERITARAEGCSAGWLRRLAFCAKAIAHSPGFVIDCPNAPALATFYGALLDWRVEVSHAWADIRSEDREYISSQQVEF